MERWNPIRAPLGVLALSLAVALTAAACPETSGPGNGPGGLTGMMLGGADGFAGIGNQGFAGLTLPNNWQYIPEPPLQNQDAGAICLNTGQCGVAGTTDAFGSVGPATGVFAFVTTSNFTDSDDGPFDQFGVPVFAVVRLSGMETDLTVPDRGDLVRIEIQFDWAYLTSRDLPAVNNDEARVEIVSSSGTSVPFSVRTADLGPGGAYDRRAGGCGTHAIPDPANGTVVETTYDVCTEWLRGSIDVTALNGQVITLRVFVEEFGGDTDQATTLLLDNVGFWGFSSS